MKDSKKIILSIAALCVLVGGTVAVRAFFSVKDQNKEQNTVDYTEETVSITEPFQSIVVRTDSPDVRILPASDGACKVTGRKSRWHTLEASVTDGTLTVECFDRRRWYERIGIFVFFGDEELTLSLPEEAYAGVRVETASGEIEIPQGFSFDEAVLSTASGDVSFAAQTEKSLKAETASGEISVSGNSGASVELRSVSGDLTLSSSEGKAALTLKTTSGEVEADKVRAQSLQATSTSGDIQLSSVHTLAGMELESVSGEIVLRACDAASLRIQTTSGDVRGTLESSKTFHAETVSGRVSLPSSQSGGVCQVETTSGNIIFD